MRYHNIVVVPRRRSYWIEAARDHGERQVIARYPSDNDAIEQLRGLRERHKAREQRRMTQEVSRFNTSNSVSVT